MMQVLQSVPQHPWGAENSPLHSNCSVHVSKEGREGGRRSSIIMSGDISYVSIA